MRMLAVLLFSFGCSQSGTKGADGTNGKDGLAALVRLDLEGPGGNCPAGGTAVRVGVDTDASGTLDDAEIADTRYVCSGAAGANGTNGVGAARLVDGNANVLGHFIRFDRGSVQFQDGAGDIWSVDTGTGSFDTFGDSLIYTSADCTGTPYYVPSVLGYMVSDGVRVYRYAGAPPASTTFSSAGGSGGCSPYANTRSDLAPYEDAGTLPLSATPPFSLQR